MPDSSNLGSYNPESGDLGISEDAINPSEFFIAAPHVARCLEGAYDLGLRHVRYAFTIAVPAYSARMRVNEQIRAVAHQILRCCPHVHFYEAGSESTKPGERLFQIHSDDGTIRHSLFACYLVTD